jgi:ABC-type branched-subunit amino acid transport system ATPase component
MSIANGDVLPAAARATMLGQDKSPLLAVDGVCKNFGGVRVLDKTTFSLAEGKVTCLVGPNGAGKTTAFDCITGFLTFEAGSIRMRGDDLTGVVRGEIVKRGIARSFQNLRLFDEMSVLDNVVVCLADESGNDPLTAIFRPFHSAAVLRRKRAHALAILEQVGLTHKAEDLVTQISYGQQKLLCIARVLATDAELLLLDEPTSGLSATALDNMVKVIAKLSESGKTLLVVEHNTRIVRDIADRIVFMHQGRVLAEGAPQEVLDRADLIEIYFGGGH